MQLKGKPVAEKIFADIKNDLTKWENKAYPKPSLTVILVGDDPASGVYVGHKTKACHELGFKSELINLPQNISQDQLIQKIKELNLNQAVDGILVQLPLPKSMNEREVLESIAPAKDVDCLTQTNIGAMVVGESISKTFTVSPCTPSGIIEIFNYYKLPLQGKKIAVIGRSLIVGTPLVHLLTQQNATVTLFHSKSEDMMSEIKQFDIVCVAIGKAEYFKPQDFKKGAIVIDVGIHRKPNNALVGDVAAGDANWLSAQTPVPGGVGPTTIAMLMKNTYLVALRNRQNKK